MKASEIRAKSVEDLHKELRELYRARMVLRMQLRTGTVTQTHNAKIIRRDIARILTILKEKEQSAVKEDGKEVTNG